MVNNHHFPNHYLIWFEVFFYIKDRLTDKVKEGVGCIDCLRITFSCKMRSKIILVRGVRSTVGWSDILLFAQLLITFILEVYFQNIVWQSWFGGIFPPEK